MTLLLPASSPGSDIQNFGREPFGLGPPEIHSHEHFRPVLRFGSACAGMNFHNGMSRHLRAERKVVRISSLRTSSSIVKSLCFNFLERGLVFFLQGKLKKNCRIVQILSSPRNLLHHPWRSASAPSGERSLPGIIPEVVGFLSFFQLIQAGYFGIQVKDNLGVQMIVLGFEPVFLQFRNSLPPGEGVRFRRKLFLPAIYYMA